MKVCINDGVLHKSRSGRVGPLHVTRTVTYHTLRDRSLTMGKVGGGGGENRRGTQVKFYRYKKRKRKKF